jgi:hypothetical protein
VIAAIPLATHDRPQAVVAYRGGEAMSLACFLGDVHATAARLPAGGYVMNLCADRYRFAVGLGAALARGVVTLLPQSLAPEPLRQLAEQYGGAGALIDPGQPAPTRGRAIAVDTGGAGTRAEMPAIDPAQLAVVAFTSGSTGTPQPQAKTWGSLAQGASAEAAALGLLPARACTLVGTVPPQHMYGLESTVLLALRNGLALHAARPLSPADVRAALEQAGGGRVLVTTPVHLHALLADDIGLPALELVVCATAPLPPATAQQVESRYGTVLREIYGFTEAGMVAGRRTALETAWHTLPGVSATATGDGVYFHGGHVPRRVLAGDILELVDADRFLLHGRGADLINVAGKRTSLAHLEHALACVDGVQDCAFYMPPEGEAMVTRPLAFAVAPGRTRAQLLQGLRERVDAVFLPRPLHLVDALPRNATGKLAREALAALAARLAAAVPAPAAAQVAPAQGDAASGDCAADPVLVPRDHPVALGHFPDHPVVPGALILDEVLRQAEARLGLAAGAWEIPVAKFVAPLRPGEPLRVALDAGRNDEVKFTCDSGGRPIASGRLRRAPAAQRG